MKIDKMIWERDPRPGYAEMKGPGVGVCLFFVLFPLLAFILAYMLQCRAHPPRKLRWRALENRINERQKILDKIPF